MKICKIRNIQLGSGKPKICVPIVGQTEKEILVQVGNLEGKPIDIVEWRADWYREVENLDAVKDILEKIREKLGDTPILFTFRTKGEGGEREITKEAYESLNKLAASTEADLIDIEYYFQEDKSKNWIKKIQDLGVKVICSNHDFAKTPTKEELVKRIREMEKAGADIAKIAVMPQNKRDVLTLLDATWTLQEEKIEIPVVTMSMGKDGLISRLSGEVFGSAMTFGAVGKVSAPGQIEVEKLEKIIKILHI